MATFLTGLWEASSGRVSKTEVQIFRTVNQLSDTVQGPVMVLMQAGSLGAVGVGAGLAYRLGFPRRAWAMASSGAGMWLACKGIKRRVGRGRPDRLLDQVIIRGRTQSGLGYPSGHSAVVAALATAAGPWQSTSGCLVASALACVVAFGRVYTGAHLPLDAIGGLGLGMSAGLLAKKAFQTKWRPR